MAYAREKFVDQVYEVQDILNEIQAMAIEYDTGFKITKDVTWMIGECERLRSKLKKILENYDEFDECDTSSSSKTQFNMSSEE